MMMITIMTSDDKSSSLSSSSTSSLVVRRSSSALAGARWSVVGGRWLVLGGGGGGRISQLMQFDNQYGYSCHTPSTTASGQSCRHGCMHVRVCVHVCVLGCVHVRVHMCACEGMGVRRRAARRCVEQAWEFLGPSMRHMEDTRRVETAAVSWPNHIAP